MSHSADMTDLDQPLGALAFIEARTKQEMPEKMRAYLLERAPLQSTTAADITVLGPRAIMTNNISSSPAIFVRALGFWTIALDHSGSAFVLDCNSGRVHYLDTGMFVGSSEKDFRIVGGVDEQGLEQSSLPVTRANVETNAEDTFENLDEFKLLIEKMGGVTVFR
jgi:hypothetical protein